MFGYYAYANVMQKGMKMKKAVNTLNLYLPFLTFHDGTCRVGWNFADTLLYFIRL